MQLLSGSPIQDFELDDTAAIVLIELGSEGEIEFADRKGVIAGCPPDGFVSGSAISNPHFHMLFVRAHALERPLMGEVPRKELDGGITLAVWPELGERGQRFEGHLFEANLGVKTQRGLQRLGVETAPSHVIEAN